MRPIRWARVTNPFGARGSYASLTDAHGPAGHHTGLDFGDRLLPSFKAIDDLPVRSSTPGTVLWAGVTNSWAGNWVGIYYVADDVTLSYWHMDRINPAIKPGVIVTRGQVLGEVGSTGNSTAQHLHVQANRGRGFDYHGHIDPSPWCRGMDTWWPEFIAARVRARRRARRARS